MKGLTVTLLTNTNPLFLLYSHALAHTSSNSSLRTRNRSRCDVKMGMIEDEFCCCCCDAREDSFEFGIGDDEDAADTVGSENESEEINVSY